MHTWKQGTAKVRTENSLCNREVQIPHLPRAQLTPRTEATLLTWAKNPWILILFYLFLSLKRGEKEQKSIISVWNWVCLGNTDLQVPVLCQQQWGDMQAHTGLSILSQHPGDVYPLFPFGSAALWDQLPLEGFAEGNPKGRSGNTGGIQVILTHPCVIYSTWEHHTRNQELMFWIPQVHSFVPIIREPPSPAPQNRFTAIKGIITLQNEPELHWYAEWVCPLLAKERLMKYQQIKDFKDN